MRWEGLTASEFPGAVRETGGVCVVPMGVLEKHGDHCPLGTDYLIARAVAAKATEKESAVVFPAFYFGQVNEARCFPGTIALPPVLMFELLDAVCDEIGRNGFGKIILYSGHDGNPYLLGYLVNAQRWQEKPYVVYVPRTRLTPARLKEMQALFDTWGGHGGEWETSAVLAGSPEMVKMEAAPDEPVESLGRLRDLGDIYTGMSWYANHPEHFAGNPRPATAEKGRAFIEAMADTLAEYIAAVRADEVAPALQDEFFRRVEGIGK